MDYQTLLEAAVTQSRADRGFVVLRDPSTGEPDQYIATHNLDPVWFQDNEVLTEHQYARQELLPMLFKQHEAMLMSNAITDLYYCRRIQLIGWVLRSIIAVPLKRNDAVYGLLWCDKGIARKGQWNQQDLQQVAALVQTYSV